MGGEQRNFARIPVPMIFKRGWVVRTAKAGMGTEFLGS